MNPLSIQSYPQYSEEQVDRLYKFSAQILTNRISNKAFCELHRVSTVGAFRMTPQEKLFAEYYQGGYSAAVASSSLLEMRAKREKMARCAFEARATTIGMDAAIAEEEKKGRPRIGLERNINSDDTTSDAINTVKARKEKMSKGDKILQGLMAAGMSEADATKLLSAGNLLSTLRAKGDNETKPAELTTHFDKSKDEKQALLIAEAEKQALENKPEPKPFVNPFAPKE